MITKLSCTLFAILLLGEAAAFSTSTRSPRYHLVDSQPFVSDGNLGGGSRREFVSKSVAILTSATVVVTGCSPAFADVSDGNALPTGAAQFGRVIRAKSDLEVRWTSDC